MVKSLPHAPRTRRLALIHLHGNTDSLICFSVDGTSLVSASCDYTLRLCSKPHLWLIDARLTAGGGCLSHDALILYERCFNPSTSAEGLFGLAKNLFQQETGCKAGQALQRILIAFANDRDLHAYHPLVMLVQNAEQHEHVNLKAEPSRCWAY